MHQISKDGGPWLMLSDFDELVSKVDVVQPSGSSSSIDEGAQQQRGASKPSLKFMNRQEFTLPAQPEEDAVDAPPPPPPAPMQQQGVHTSGLHYASAHVSHTSAAAVWSMVLGILSLVTALGALAGIPAIICGHISRSNIRRSNGSLSGDGMAVSGLILGYIATILTILVIIILVTSPIAFAAFMESLTE